MLSGLGGHLDSSEIDPYSVDTVQLACRRSIQMFVKAGDYLRLLVSVTTLNLGLS